MTAQNVPNPLFLSRMTTYLDYRRRLRDINRKERELSFQEYLRRQQREDEQREEMNAIQTIKDELSTVFSANSGATYVWKEARMNLMKKFGSDSLAFQFVTGERVPEFLDIRQSILLGDRLDQATRLTANIKLLNDRTKGAFQTAVMRMEFLKQRLANNLRTSLNSPMTDMTSEGWSRFVDRMLITTKDHEETKTELFQLYKLFLQNIGSISGRSKLWTPTKENDSVIRHLIHAIKKGFAKLIATFCADDWKFKPSLSKKVPPLTLNQTGIDDIGGGLSAIQSEMNSAFPSDRRKLALGKLQNTSKNVSLLRDETQTLIVSLESVSNLVQSICASASEIRKSAKTISKDFNGYSKSLMAALTFFEFLPFNDRYIDHVTRAQYYLAGRKLNVKFAHFLAAFDALLAS